MAHARESVRWSCLPYESANIPRHYTIAIHEASSLREIGIGESQYEVDVFGGVPKLGR